MPFKCPCGTGDVSAPWDGLLEDSHWASQAGLRQAGLLPSHGKTKTGDTYFYHPRKEGCETPPCCCEAKRTQGTRRSYRASSSVTLSATGCPGWQVPEPAPGTGSQAGNGAREHWDSDNGGSGPPICNSKAWVRAGSPLGAELVAGIVGASEGCAGTAATPGQPMAGQELAQGSSFQEGSPVQLSKTCSLAPGANFQECLAAWESLSCLHVQPFKEFVLPS